MGIYIAKAGMLTTVQDLGRFGWQASGVPVGGAMDQRAAMLANAAVNNPFGEALLEFTLIGPELVFETEAVVAIAGADMAPLLDGEPAPRLKPFVVRRNSRLAFHSAKNGVRTYLAVKGGFSLPEVLSSKSTLLSAKLGGLHGESLKNGDRLPLEQSWAAVPAGWRLSPQSESYLEDDSPLRFVRGRQYGWVDSEAHKTFVSSLYKVSPNSDRMGCRLTGPALTFAHSMQLPTEGTAFGSIQIPPDGQPIILMADRQPTGGYPKIGEILTSDLPRLSQKAPGSHVRFEEIPLKTAQELLRENLLQLQLLKSAAALKWSKEESGKHV